MELVTVNRKGVASSILYDVEDLKTVLSYTWRVNSRGYAVSNVYLTYDPTTKKQGGEIRFMHREIMGCAYGDGKLIDHINGNKIDNRRSNLRFCTPEQNNANMKKVSGKTSVFKGVSFRPLRNKWESRIRVAGRIIFLGHYENEIDAANAYDQAAKNQWGEYARPNFQEVH